MSDNKALGENFLRKHEADLRNFLYRATRYLYSAEGEKERDRENGSEMSSYDEDDWTAALFRMGTHPFTILLAVTYREVVCFTMTCHETMPATEANRAQIDEYLREAWRQPEKETPWRGPKDLRFPGEARYYNHWTGDLKKFQGHEEIWWDFDSPQAHMLNKRAYNADYVGGVVNLATMFYNDDMEVTLRKFAETDGELERKFLLSFPEEENGFRRPGYELGEKLDTAEDFAKFVQLRMDNARGLRLPEGHVPSTTFWVLVDGELAGIGKVRHYLNDALMKHGGHIGLSIAKKFRGKGVGKAALQQLITFTRDIDHPEVLITAQENNVASRSIIEVCGGELEKIENGHAFYWV